LLDVQAYPALDLETSGASSLTVPVAVAGEGGVHGVQ
jgi:hypothetical protein